jgi:hypothetical protein
MEARRQKKELLKRWNVECVKTPKNTDSMVELFHPPLAKSRRVGSDSLQIKRTLKDLENTRKKFEKTVKKADYLASGNNSLNGMPPMTSANENQSVVSVTMSQKAMIDPIMSKEAKKAKVAALQKSEARGASGHNLSSKGKSKMASRTGSGIGKSAPTASNTGGLEVAVPVQRSLGRDRGGRHSQSASELVVAAQLVISNAKKALSQKHLLRDMERSQSAQVL